MVGFSALDYFFEKICVILKITVSFFALRVLIDSEGVIYRSSADSLLHLENCIVVNRVELPSPAR